MSRGFSRWLLAIAACALLVGLGPAPAWAERGKAKSGRKENPGKSELVPKGNVPRGNPPPPPPVVFRQEPEVILIPRTRVYYVPDLKYDLFRYGRHWYINNGGSWYRARSYGGPYTFLEFGEVPSTIVRLPDKYHRQPVGPAARANSRD